ncbi:MAG: peptidase M28, partial [Gemmatimonadaceae bacterium]|nr:peptidase M28 [Gemmatimonadaceae bacterium]
MDLSRHCRLVVLTPVLVLSATVSGAQSAPRPDADPRIASLVSAVSQERLREIATRLAGFGTRSTLSDTLSTTRGI